MKGALLSSFVSSLPLLIVNSGYCRLRKEKKNVYFICDPLSNGPVQTCM